MAVTTIAHKPDLTKEQAQEIFRKHFEGKYSVKKVSRAFRDFMVVKNAFVGVDVKLQQGSNETKFVYSGFAPHPLARLLLGGLIAFMFWRSLTTEVREFIESAPEFK